MLSSLVIVKVGGSLFDLPDLGPRLRSWLRHLNVPEVLLVPGGGTTTDAVRDLDRRHSLGEEAAHWLALHALALNARFLAELSPPLQATVVADPAAAPACWEAGVVPILDGHQFARRDEGRPGCLPHSWSVTSDSLAVRVAVVTAARRLILLKSVTFPAGIAWQKAGECGLVDGFFATALAQATTPLAVEAVNLRDWSAARPECGP